MNNESIIDNDGSSSSVLTNCNPPNIMSNENNYISGTSTPVRPKNDKSQFLKKQPDEGERHDVVKDILDKRIHRSNIFDGTARMDNRRHGHPNSFMKTNRKINLDDDDLSDKEFANKHSQRQNKRRNEQHERLINDRGRLDMMEKFIFDNERKRELESLQKVADEVNDIPDDLLEEIENEFDDELSDNELIEYFDKKEQYERDLEEMLADLSLDS